MKPNSYAIVTKSGAHPLLLGTAVHIETIASDGVARVTVCDQAIVHVPLDCMRPMRPFKVEVEPDEEGVSVFLGDFDTAEQALDAADKYDSQQDIEALYAFAYQLVEGEWEIV